MLTFSTWNKFFRLSFSLTTQHARAMILPEMPFFLPALIPLFILDRSPAKKMHGHPRSFFVKGRNPLFLSLSG